MGRRQQQREGAAFTPPEEVHSLEAGGVQHSVGILHPLLQRLDAGRPVREACTALVEPDKPGEGGHPLAPPDPVRLFPVECEVRDPAGDHEQIGRAALHNLVGDVDPARLHVRDRRRGRRRAQHLPVERLRLLGRLEPEPGKRRAQPVVLLDRSGAVAGVRVHVHQRTVRRFVGRLLGDHLLPKPGSTQQLQIEGANVPAALPGPVLVALVGKQLAPVATRNRRACLGTAGSQSQLALRLKALGIDRELGVRPQADLTLAKDYRLLRAERRSRVMGRLAEVRGARVGRKVRPESVGDLLALQPMPRRQGEQLHELGRPSLLPCPPRDAASVDRHLEPTEDADLDASHTPRMLPAMPASKDASTALASPDSAGKVRTAGIEHGVEAWESSTAPS